VPRVTHGPQQGNAALTDALDSLAPSLRELKKARTRRAIADAALDLFEANGYEATTVEDIARAAEVAPRTFFRYFATKDEALFERADEVTGALHLLLAARPADEPLLTSLREVGAAVVAHTAVDEPRLRRILALVASEPALRARYTGLLADIEEEVARWAAGRLGVDPGDLLPRLIAATALAARRVAMDAWLSSDDDDLGGHIARAIDLLAAGLGTVVPAAARGNAADGGSG